jgi:uncharacterized coiled-coil protein SlyX
MNNDLISKALEGVKGIQKTVGDAMHKRAEAAPPIIREAVGKANVIRESLVHGIAEATDGAKPHLEEALTHLNGFIATGKEALTAGVAKAQEQLGPLTEQLRKTIESTTQATAKKPEEPAHEPDAAPK